MKSILHLFSTALFKTVLHKKFLPTPNSKAVLDSINENVSWWKNKKLD